MGKGSENYVKCISDNDCYALAGYPTDLEKTNTCCTTAKILAYDTSVPEYIAILAAGKKLNADYTMPAVGYTSRMCNQDYPKYLGAENFTNDVTNDALFKLTGIKYSEYCNSAVALQTMTAVGSAYLLLQ